MENKTFQIYSTTSTPSREVTPYWREKYEKDARKYWDIFYKRHQDKFFKDRHYLDKEWGRHFCTEKGRRLVVLEVGCGAGNTIFPLLSMYPEMFIHACDFSPRAIALVKGHKYFSADHVNAFVCDLLVDDLCEKVEPSSVDIVTMIFVLSAVSPEKMNSVLENIRKVLKPNGRVLFRDYADGDLAQERLTSKEQMISENFYVRGDGTRAFYFSVEFLSNLFSRNGYCTEDISVCCKQVENRSLKLQMNRRWIQAVFSPNPSPFLATENLDSHDPETVNIRSVEHDMDHSAPLVCDPPLPECIESIDCLFKIAPPNEEIIDIKLKSCNYRIKVVGKENQHTCRLTGLMLWESAYFMALVLDENPSIVAEKRVVELGCGSAGIFSMVAAQSAELVVSTDGDMEALDLLRKNIASNLDPALLNKLIINRLVWGDQTDIGIVKDLSKPKEGFDVVVGTDVSYNPESIKPLFETARKLIADGACGKAKAAFILCHIPRRADEESIITTATQFEFRLADRSIHGESAPGGIISSWLSHGLRQLYSYEKTPLNIMLFHI